MGTKCNNMDRVREADTHSPDNLSFISNARNPSQEQAHKSINAVVPCASGNPRFDISRGDGGWQPGFPSLEGGEVVGDGTCGDSLVTGVVGAAALLEQAVSTSTIRKL